MAAWVVNQQGQHHSIVFAKDTCKLGTQPSCRAGLVMIRGCPAPYAASDCHADNARTRRCPLACMRCLGLNTLSEAEAWC